MTALFALDEELSLLENDPNRKPPLPQMIGARSVAATLWPVGDAATQALMAELYRQMWLHGRPMAEALREAQRWLREQGRAHLRQGPNRGLLGREDEALPADAPLPPHIWAGFVFSGDWRWLEDPGDRPLPGGWLGD